MNTNTAELLRQLNEGFEITLPSGIPATIKRFSIVAYKRGKKVPSNLKKLVKTFTETNLANAMQEHPNETEIFFEWVITESLIDPKVAVFPKDDITLPLDYLPEQDKLFIFQSALNPAQTIQEHFSPLQPTSTLSPDATDAAPQTSST